MAIDNFIPELWSAALLTSLSKVLVYGQGNVINTDYEGMIKRMGDTVRINAIGEITINDYVKNQTITDPQELLSAQTVLNITQAKFFNFMVDDVDAVQANVSVMLEAMRRASYALRNVIDQFIAGQYTDVSASNLIASDASPFIPTITAGTGFNDAYDKIVDLGIILDQNNVPEDGRFVIIPPKYVGYLLKDNRFVNYGTEMNRATLATGQIGRISGLDVLTSNNVPNTAATKYKVLAGHKMAWTFANQINQVEAFRPYNRFADAIKGLALYGSKVVRPECLALLTTSP